VFYSADLLRSFIRELKEISAGFRADCRFTAAFYSADLLRSFIAV
jgi:hypothetical protein